MAIIHKATLTPGKLDLLGSWLPEQSWFPGGKVARIGSFRFDDPAGEVGIETFLLAAGEAVVQVPLTYRSAPLDGAADWLVGTLQHSVLGQRWVYDGCADPVYATALARALLAGEPQAKHLLETGGVPQELPESVFLHSAGTPGTMVPTAGAVAAVPEGKSTVLRSEAWTLVVRRVLDLGNGQPSKDALTGTWEGQSLPVGLATAAS